MKISILGTGRAVPAQCDESTSLDRQFNAKGRITSAGVKTRYRCTSESQIDLAVMAAEIALGESGCSIHDIDLIVSAAAVAYQPIPSMAPLIMRELGAKDGSAAAYDVNSTCLSFISGLELASRMVDSGASKRALIVSSEVASRALPWEESPEVAALFGDGAAAAVIGSSPPKSQSEIKAFRLRTYPSAYSACEIGAGGTRFDFAKEHDAFAAHATFVMDGKTLFRVASQHFKLFVDDLLIEADWHREDVDLVVPHQASPMALDHMIRQTGFRPEQVLSIVEDYGNQIAASIPFVFDFARKERPLKEGSKILFLGTSAGVSFGGAALVL